MKIRVLGCHGGELPKHRTTCFLLDGSICIDAGAITSTLSLEEICRLDHIFLTHSHYDHIKDVPLMTDLLVGRRKAPVVVHAPPATVEALDLDVFNNRTWPDFRAIPTKENPVIAFEALKPRTDYACGGYRFKAIPVHHPVYTVGYVIQGPQGSIAFSGDTGPTQEFWGAVNEAKDLKAVFVELSFPSTQQWLADISGHLTPTTVMSELKKLDRRGARVYLYHLKPSVIDEIKREVQALGQDYLHVCELDEEYAF